MPQAKRSLEDYVTVAERIERFYEKFPNGSIQSEIIHDDGKRVLIRSSAFRSALDKRPGVAHAEEIRGAGPVNQTSAVENCETSAMGRAIAALGFEVKKGIASREEVEQAHAERERQAESVPAVERIGGERIAELKDRIALLFSVAEDADDAKRDLQVKFGSMGVAGASSVNVALAALTPAQADELDRWLKEGE